MGISYKCFNEVYRVLQKSVVVVWHSSQLPEQKEGLFLIFVELSVINMGKDQIMV